MTIILGFDVYGILIDTLNKEGVARLKGGDFKLFAFPNGNEEAIETLLVSAGIREFFHGVVSVDEVKSFKPNPAVYEYFLKMSGATAANA